MTLRLHNTLTRQIETFAPIEAGHVRMYVCGITIYDLCHVGHARMMIAFDLIYRWLRTLGYKVTYVRNITDIDDKIIRRAVQRGITLRALTDEMVDAMHADLDALGIGRPTHEPRATEYVPQMLSMIGTLEQRGLAYRSTNGDVNFAVRKFPRYGALSGKSIDELRSGERVAVLEGKQDPLDFVLWKAAKPDEPEDAKYASSYGPGRPGWHIECSAMACALLGEHFDLHGGGADLQFPHHDNEIAQSQGATGRPPAAVWVHNGLLNVDNTKMSKSLGNFFTIREVLARYDAETLRFFMLRTHYRSPFNFGDANLDDARNALRRLYTALQGAPLAAGEVDWSAPRAASFRAAMNDDFNTPVAMAVMFELAGEANRGVPGAAVLLRRLGATLGLLQQEAQTYLRTGDAVDADHVEARIAARVAAKQARDYAL
ncbi:MAG: cysteine--tRNA ligase, partial [Burkholderiaceae bacterium]